MADEPKVPPLPSGPGETPAKSPVAEGGGTLVPAALPGKSADATLGEAAVADPAPKPQPPVPAKRAAVAPEIGSTPAKPIASPQPPAVVPPKPPAAAKAPIKPDPWASPLLDELRKRFSSAIADAVIFRNQPCVTVAREFLIGICEFLKSDEGGAYTYLVDETAIDYPKREKRFEIIYVLYSFEANDRLRLKVMAGENEKIPSVTGLWPVANWLEREVFDMFGVTYEGHPDLRRILMPDGWVGHPLRKDYDILRQDQDWVQANLHIESGQ